MSNKRSRRAAPGGPGSASHNSRRRRQPRSPKGTLPGAFYGQPQAVVYCATEDSWDMTIVPRLMAAGADLDLVYRVQVSTDRDGHASLTLPTDTDQLEKLITEHDVAMVVMDPLLSLLDARVNDYRAREVRDALEPLVAMADRTRVVLLGLAHFTKGSGSDPLLFGLHRPWDRMRAAPYFCGTVRLRPPPWIERQSER